MPKHYWDVLIDYYYFVNTPRDREDDDSDGAVVDFDKMSTRRRMTMKEKWGQETWKGDPT